MSKDEFKNDVKPNKRGFDYKLFLVYPSLLSLVVAMGFYSIGEDPSMGLVAGYPSFFFYRYVYFKFLLKIIRGFPRFFNLKMLVIYPALFSIFVGLGTYFNGEGSESVAVALIFGYPTFFLAWILYRMVKWAIMWVIKAFRESSQDFKNLDPLLDDIKTQIGIDPKQRQEKFFEKQTIPELKNYIQSREYSEKMPSIKADFVNVALRLWTVEQQQKNGK